MRLLALVVLAACGTASLEGPRAIRTAEHLEEARKLDEVARSRTWLVTEEVTPPARPFAFTWNPDADHERVKQQRSEVAAVEQDFEAACHQHEVEKTIGSPLTRHRIGGWNTEDGVVILLGVVAGPRETLLADLRCYRAWLIAGTGVDKDALALPGLLLDAKGTQDGITLTLTLEDTALIPELQRRVLRQVEASRRLAGHEY